MIVTGEVEARDWVAGLDGVDQAAMERLDRLAAMLAEENERQNLVSAASLGEVWRRHIADSAQLLRHVPSSLSGTWLDLGTGAGFPGLVIAALRPELDLVMVESRRKRIEWLGRAADLLGLAKARVIGERLERVPNLAAAVISARAFAPLDKLLDLSARFSTSDTIWLLPKGRSARDEVAGLTGWSHVFHVEQSLTDPDAGVVVGTIADCALRGRPLKKKAQPR
jgi:16S rRNA (guanine527-N7)-methyltransferase